ncbi:hypothetical protein K8B33_02045 [Alcanivorax sp. JB21]|uniref:hypothetical protein n=1 Tax=Alcanivorax limicola TaxID=2874102 RepID=UPI001CBD6EDF|nr:hypothetical protein [Alcanivorax limicola]MBZ2187865.1 hypothetical protein [Alcanivorax limicola]
MSQSCFPVRGVIALTAALFCAVAVAEVPGDFRILDYRASELGAAAGRPVASLSVLSWQDGALQPISFQIDSIGEADLVWFPESGLTREGDPERFLADDRLLIRAADIGPRAPKDVALPDGVTPLAELAIEDVTGGPGYVYLVEGDNRRNPARYIDHDIESGITRTHRYQLHVDPENELNWRHLGYAGYEGDGSIIDTLKMRMSGGFLSRRARMTLDNTNLRPQLAGSKVGPLRSVMHLETRVVLGGIPVMRLQVQAYRYPDHYEAHSYARIPALYRNTLRDPEVAVSIDGNAQYGATVQTARGKELRGLVDGRMDDEEQQLIERGLTTTDSWILFDSRRNFILLADLDVPASLQDIPLTLVYQDDNQLEITPEQFPGQLPNIGYALRGWPPERELRFAVRLLFGNAIADDYSPEDYVAARMARPSLSVTPWSPSYSSQSVTQPHH